MANLHHPDSYRSSRDLYLKCRNPISVDQVLANTADTSTDQVSPLASNYVYVCAQREPWHFPESRLSYGSSYATMHREAHLRLEAAPQCY